MVVQRRGRAMGEEVGAEGVCLALARSLCVQSVPHTAKRRRVFVAHGWTSEASGGGALEPCKRSCRKGLQFGGWRVSSRQAEPQRSSARRRLARNGPGRALLGAAARAMTCSAVQCGAVRFRSGGWATLAACGLRYTITKSRQCADSGAYYAVAPPSRHRRRTSPAALGGGSAPREPWGRVKVSRSLTLRLHMFTCQSSALHVSEASEVWAATAAEATLVPRISQTPIISTATLACHSQASRGADTAIFSCRLLLSERSEALRHSLGALLTSTIHGAVCNTRPSYCLQRACSIEYLLREPVDPREAMHAIGNYLGLASVSSP